MIQPVILCGGSGTRLWPASRAGYPKQFSALLGPESLYQATLRRLSGEAFGAPLVVTAEPFRFLATDQAAAVGVADAEVLTEPAPRNTAPAVLAAALARADDPDTLLLVAPADHVIARPDAFRTAVAAGAEAARSGRLVCFGVRPTRPETGYGYLALAAADPAAGVPVELAGFEEKPDAERAAALVAGGRHLWNAGLFLFRVGDILAAFETHAPDMMAPAQAALAGGAADLGFYRLAAAPWESLPAISLDHAVMERADNLAAVPFEGGWADLGSWRGLWERLGQDPQGVAVTGPATALDCTDTLLRAEPDGPHLVGLGLRNVIAVAMRDAVLVADMDASQQVREVVELLAAQGVPQADVYPRCHRPWGWYETLCTGGRFQVKRIMVKPGGLLSLQSHMHRAEHWVVVEGTARITRDGDSRLLTENESVYIPLGATHRLENPGRVPMYLIEVQTGTYLGEDDIVRYEDVYHRDPDGADG